MKINIDNDLTAEDVVTLRKVSGWDHDTQEWQKCLNQNIINVSARNEAGNVVAVGFLSGNQRHAELIDLVVHPDYRNRGIGTAIVRIIVDYVREEKIRYFGLTFDASFPWLKDFYESEGFRTVDFAMWHTSSLK